MQVAKRTLEEMQCRFCDHVAYGESHENAIHALAVHVKRHHPEVAAQAQSLVQYGSPNVIPFRRKDAR